MEACNTSSSQGRKTSYASDHQLYSVRKPLYKPWRKPVAPLPSNPTRVYKVKPIEFKDLVQKLTGAQQAPELQTSRLQTVAPAPLEIHPTSLPAEVKAERVAKNYTSPAAINSLGFALSPSSNSWCSFLLTSPGSMSGLDQSTVL